MMTNKDLRRFARERWKRLWPTILAAFVLLFSVYIALVICFSFVLSPFLLTNFLPGIEELRRGISLSISGILLALLVFVLVMYLIVTSFSILYMALKSVRGQSLSPFDIFYTLRPENYPMQIRILAYSLLYTAVPWLFSLMTFFLFGSSANNPLLSMAEEVFFNVLIGVFLMFFLCTPFFLLETKSIGLIEAMKKSAEWMKPERARFFRHVLYFLGLRLIANVLAEMWGYILQNSILPGFFLLFFFLLFLSPYYILVQAAFYQDILAKKKIEEEREATVQEASKEESETELREVPKEEPKKASEEEPKKEIQEEPKKEIQEEPKTAVQEEPKKASEEEPKEELSFEEARKRYTDYKEEEES